MCFSRPKLNKTGSVDFKLAAKTTKAYGRQLHSYALCELSALEVIILETQTHEAI